MPTPEPSRPRRAQRGQSTVEFALVIIIFTYMLFGLLDFGKAVYDYNTLANAAREGARYAIVRCQYSVGSSYWTTATVTTAARAEIQAIASAVTVTPSPVDGSTANCSAPGTPISVQVSTTFIPLTPLISQLIGGSIALSATSTMYSE